MRRPGWTGDARESPGTIRLQYRELVSSPARMTLFPAMAGHEFRNTGAQADGALRRDLLPRNRRV